MLDWFQQTFKSKLPWKAEKQKLWYDLNSKPDEQKHSVIHNNSRLI